VTLGLAGYALWRLIETVSPVGEDHNARGIASRIGDISPALEAGSVAKADIYLPRVKASLLIEGIGGEETL